jgi:hypothetical protein
MRLLVKLQPARPREVQAQARFAAVHCDSPRPSIKCGDFAAQLGDRAAGRVMHCAFEVQR